MNNFACDKPAEHKETEEEGEKEKRKIINVLKAPQKAESHKFPFICASASCQGQQEKDIAV